jgi:hypothetical protein
VTERKLKEAQHMLDKMIKLNAELQRKNVELESELRTLKIKCINLLR